MVREPRSGLMRRDVIGRPWPTRLRTAAAVLVLAALGTMITLTVHPGALPGRAATAGAVAAAWALFVTGALLVRRLPVRTATVLILAGGAILPFAAGLGPPRTSDDLYRYLWDGRVQAAGIDPYRYPPAAPELRALRDPELWPSRSAWCVADGATDPANGRPLAPGCTLINRPTVRTIYPPAAQAYFLGVHAVTPSVRAMQLAAAALALATTLLLLAALPRLGIDRRRALLWAWCPLVALETGNNAHVDVLAALLTVAAVVTLARSDTVRADIAGGGLLALAVATKLTPALVGPALLRRPPPRLLALLAAAATGIALVYLPHVLAVGPAVLGYLPGYLTEEGYTDGTRFALLTVLVPDTAAPAVAVAVLSLVALLVARRADPARPWRGAVLLVGAALLVATPAYPWYAILLVALLALDGRGEWLAVAAAGHAVVYVTDLGVPSPTVQSIAYAAAAVAIAATAVTRRRSGPGRGVEDTHDYAGARR